MKYIKKEFIVINPREWDEILGSIQLCVLPISVADFEELYSVHFLESVEEGLGMCFYLFIKANDIKIKLSGIGSDKHGGNGLLVEIRSFENSPRKCFELIKLLFDFSKVDLKWFRDDLNDAKWTSTVELPSTGRLITFCFIEKEMAVVFNKLVKSKNNKLFKTLEKLRAKN